MSVGEDMVRRAADAIAWTWDQPADVSARAALTAALTDLPAADGWCRWVAGRMTAIAYPAGAGRQVEVVVDGVVEHLSPDDAEVRAFALLACARKSRALAHQYDHLTGGAA